jgi:hypothetical protein
MSKFFLASLAFFFALELNAQPSTLSYQGVLADANGVYINGERDIIFKVYTSSTGGDLLATDVHNGAYIANGLFNVELNFGSLDFSKELWLEMTVGGTTLNPRVKFNASGYALAGQASSLKIAQGAGAGKVLTSDANGAASWTSPQVGLANFSESRNTSSPNDTKPAHALTATGSESNIDMVISPKGTGALTASIPNGSASGGNKRGNNAVDLQTARNSATQVASGIYSTISGGSQNTANLQYSSVGGGSQNTAKGPYSRVSGGSANTASGGSSNISGGANNSAAGSGSTVTGGFYNTASGDYSSVIGGIQNTAQSYGEIVAGLNATVGAGNNEEYVASDRLFVVGNGADENNRSDALKIL